jgi:hypothetical protein
MQPRRVLVRSSAPRRRPPTDHRGVRVRRWERSIDGYGPIWADASAHRILSDLSPLLSARGHRLLIAGDLNLLCGYGEHGNVAAKRRYQTVFDRAEALGLTYLGPRAPEGGRQPDPWPDELPTDNRTVPTYHTRSQGPAGATRQLDHVFASTSITDTIRVAALNEPDEWGPSDHCQIMIELSTMNVRAGARSSG